MKTKSSLASKICSAPYYLWAAIFIVIPLCMVFYYAFTDSAGNFTLSNLSEIPLFADTYLISILLGIIATVICLIIGYPVAYIISKINVKKQSIVLMLIMLPMWINLLLRTYALMMLMEDTGIINSILSFLHLPTIHMINTNVAVVIGMVYNFLPYMILPLYTVMTSIDRSVIEASHDLGAGSVPTFIRVIFPLTAPGIISGITMVLVPSVSTFYISQKLGGGMSLIGDVIERKFISEYNYNTGASLSLVLMAMILLCLFIMNRFGGEEEAIV